MAKLKPNQFILDGHLITERPILFQAEMVQATLGGKKKQTRRTKGLDVDEGLVYDKIEFNPQDWPKKPLIFKKKIQELGNVDYYEITAAFKCPYGQPGDLLWVKENWTKIESRIFYQADNIDAELIEVYNLDKVRWKPSIHLYKEYSRIWLMIENVRVERLQDISEEDAIDEGVARSIDVRLKSQPTRYKVYTDSDPEALYTSTAKDSFETLWISINGQESWNQKPWVWVIKFRVLSKTRRPSNEEILASRFSILHARTGLASQRKEVSDV